MYLASDDDPASAEYVTMPRAEIRRRLEPHIGEVMSAASGWRHAWCRPGGSA
jgi:hypothetical protein